MGGLYKNGTQEKSPDNISVIRALRPCRRRDSNPHASRRHPLKMVCLPIPPLRRSVISFPALPVQSVLPAVQVFVVAGAAHFATWRPHELPMSRLAAKSKSSERAM